MAHNHLSRALTQFLIDELFGNYGRTTSVERTVKAFKICCIFSYEPDVFSEEDFASAVLRDQIFTNQIND